jgi:hypothetical protein
VIDAGAIGGIEHDAVMILRLMRLQIDAACFAAGDPQTDDLGVVLFAGREVQRVNAQITDA